MLPILLAACHDPTSSDEEGPADTTPVDSGTTGIDTTPSDTTPSDTTPPLTGLDPDVDSFLPPDYVPVDPVRIVFVGDSITEGYGASEPRLKYSALLQYNQPDVWPGFDDVDLETSYPDLVEVVDVSLGGATTKDVLEDQIPELAAALAPPVSGETIVVMTIGGNDLQAALIPFADAETIVDNALDNLTQIVDRVLDPATFPDGVYLYATNVYEPSDGVGQSPSCFFGIDYGEDLPQLDRFNDAMRAMGEERGFAVLDLRGHFLGHGYHSEESTVPGYDAADPTLWFASDCIHPNDRGHHELRRLSHAAISREPLEYRLPE